MNFFSSSAKRSLLGSLGILIMLLCSAGKAVASHYAAADMYVDYIGNGPGDYRYKVTLKVYKACEPFSSSLGSESFSVSSPSGCNSFSTSRFMQPKQIDTLDQLCADFKPFNSCRVPTDTTLPAFIRHTFTDTITLPSACPDWTFVWTSGARNGGIANLQNPSSLSIYIACRINNQAKYNNSSPRFLVDPLPYLCAGQPATYLNGPLDPNNDSLQILNTLPRIGATTFATYQPPYTNANPVGSTTGYTVDPTTGTASFNPAAQGKYVLSFRCNEYDRFTGVLLGYIERDVQVAVFNCPAPPPVITRPLTLSGGQVIDTTNNTNKLSVCPNSTITFNITSTSNQSNGVMVLTSNNKQVAPSSTFTVPAQGTNTITGTFTWTPDSSDVGDHTFIFIGTDSTCSPGGTPILQRSYTVVLVKVPSGIEAGENGFYCPGSGKGYQINVRAPASLNFTWTPMTGLTCPTPNCQNPIAMPDSTTTYIVTAAVSPYVCKRVDTITIFTVNASILNGNETVLCKPGYLQLDAVSSGPRPTQKIVCGGSVQSTRSIVDTVTVGFGTNSSTVTTPFNTYYSTARTQMLFRRGELMAAGLKNSTIRQMSFFVSGSPNGTLANFSIQMKCTPTNALAVASGFESGATTVFTSSTPVILSAGWNTFTFTNPYNWDTTQNLLVNVCFSNPTASYNTSPAINYTTTGFNSVLYAYNYSGSVCQSVGPYGPYLSTARPNVRFNSHTEDTLEYSYFWRPGTYLSDSSIKNPVAYIPHTTGYALYVMGKDGCIVKDTTTIIVPTDKFFVSPRDTAICYGEGVLLQASPAQKYTWYENGVTPAPTLTCSDCPKTIATPKENTTYTVTFSNFHGASSTECPFTDTVNVTIKPLPIVTVTPKDTLVKYGRGVRLQANGANLYYWSPVASLNSPTGSSVLATVIDSATYIVTGLAENGCRNTDTAHLRVDYRDALFVPTAFTPNGDRVNDEFKISNLSFQKISEFRVFNRWGQEIFSTNDGARGWDGSWKGVEQPTGVYQYIIRIAYPDGMTETYKGDVTLIR
jgi:gliding motility-associated-like protein